ncbi:N-acetylglucosamine kinase [Paenibacillus sp. IHBB 10380]|uniref:N-acetylglucosamine kinase n=1 Tax=Paenibacillus sp. IHBB 10380 TaxID=1566358 RepID=UPI0005CF92BB|nr:BadF/BadG/BcrA/BcrD ATPase family protein [Paenibacillus sp. IHBB 10380]AJS58214.1 N-acetylglucosamine kinase [Paenibacillus sp. IHBB 10380]
MNKKYIIGVDGGNSKTDYFLYDVQGNFIDHINTGTCSHERFPDSYISAYRIMDENIQQLLTRNYLSMDDITAGAFGLAGADVPSQKEQLCQVIERIGFTHYALDNDSFLGVKAGSEKGFGICSINGSGTSTGGISPSGDRLQVGGVGSELSGDEAGGFFLARKIVRAVYDSFYRMGQETKMTEPVMELLQIPGKQFFIEYAVDAILKRTLPNTKLMQIMFTAADKGDPVALDIVDHTAKQLACSTVGCMHNLDFGHEVDIVLAGSVWVKAESPLLFQRYKEYVARLTHHDCHYIILYVPPATGAVLWALELAWGHPVDSGTRRRVIESIEHLRKNEAI